MDNSIKVRSPDLVKEANLLVVVDFAVLADDRIELKVNKKVKQISWTEKFWSNAYHFLSTGNGLKVRNKKLEEETIQRKIETFKHYCCEWMKEGKDLLVNFDDTIWIWKYMNSSDTDKRRSRSSGYVELISCWIE